MVSEIINLAKRKKDPCLMLKVNFKTAYDSVSWNFLDYMLGIMGFNDKWRDWIKACIFIGSISLLVNDSPTKEFSVERP